MLILKVLFHFQDDTGDEVYIDDVRIRNESAEFFWEGEVIIKIPLKEMKHFSIIPEYITPSLSIDKEGMDFIDYLNIKGGSEDAC